MSRESQIATLNAVAEARKRSCLDRTEKAISQLVKKNEQISFSSVAREAGVSVSYLYKYSEIKERIQALRKQQKVSSKKLTRPQTASENSKQVIITQLRERINTLRWEKNELTKQNEALTGNLYALGNLQDLLDRIKAENCRLNDENKRLRAELESTIKEWQSRNR